MSNIPPSEFYSYALDEMRFDISLYNRCATLDARGWQICMMDRMLIDGLLQSPSWIEDPCAERREHLLSILHSRFKDPCGPEWTEKFFSSPSAAYEYRAVRDISVYAARHFNNYNFQPEVLDQIENAYAKRDLLRNEDHPVLDLSVHSLALQHYDPTDDGDFSIQGAAVSVDLGCANEVLIEHFKRWLNRKREEMSAHNVRLEIGERVTPKRFRQWHEHRVLAFVDLQALAALLGVRLTDAVAGNLLFENQTDISVSEKVRKTVRPLAKSFVSAGTLVDIGPEVTGHQREPEQKSP